MPVLGKIKVSAAGDLEVGKTSLVERYISGSFDDSLTMTIGANAFSREFSIPSPGGGDEARAYLEIWDISGAKAASDPPRKSLSCALMDGELQSFMRSS